MSASASAASLGGGADVEDDEDECVVCFEAERNAREWRRWQAVHWIAGEGWHAGSKVPRFVACVAAQCSAHGWVVGFVVCVPFPLGEPSLAFRKFGCHLVIALSLWAAAKVAQAPHPAPAPRAGACSVHALRPPQPVQPVCQEVR